jgi:hypothetical protein
MKRAVLFFFLAVLLGRPGHDADRAARQGGDHQFGIDPPSAVCDPHTRVHPFVRDLILVGGEAISGAQGDFSQTDLLEVELT